MKEIQLTQGKVTIVDNDDFERLTAFKWYAYFSGHNWYVKRGNWVNGKMKIIRMHREILNVPKGVQVDHINGNGLDNRKENLRRCTSQQNKFNQRNPHKDNKLGVKGVCWLEARKKFIAQIAINGKVFRLGYFDILGEADVAYRIAEKKYFGEFARMV